jgi:predicted RNA-binding protein (virulence factor B family)
MSILGQYASLNVNKVSDYGFYLDGGELGEILLPQKQTSQTFTVGEQAKVFVYLDSNDLPIATTRNPKAVVGDFANLTVTDVTRVGAFLDWGLDKDILLPFSEQTRPLEEGNSVMVHLYIDDIDNRITATAKLDKYLQDSGTGIYEPREKVNIIIAAKTDLGFKAIVNGTHWGLIFEGEVFETLKIGQRKTAFIKRIRPDGKIDITFNGGQVSRDKNAKVILDYLNDNRGFAPFHDKTDAKLISKVFGISKGAFKKAIGGLYKNGDIVIEKDGIKLAK